MGAGGQAVLGSWLRSALLLGVTAPCVLLLERFAPERPAPEPSSIRSARRRRGDVAFLVAQAVYLPALGILVGGGASRLGGAGLLFSVTRRGPAVFWAAVVFVGADLVAYWTHRGLHGRTLWRVHRLHHDPRVRDWLSGFRFHPIDAAIEQALPVLPFVVLGFPPVTVAPYVVAVALVVTYAHADISTPNTTLAGVVVTPAYHRVHHAIGGTGANFALVLPVMDRVFHTTAGGRRGVPQRSTSRPTANDSPLAA